MSDDTSSADGDRAAASTRTLEIVVAALLFALGALVVVDSYRLGSKWGSDGPESGYFPFYIGSLLCISSAVIFAKALRDTSLSGTPFVYRQQLKRVLTVLIPAAIYVLLVSLLGLYVASAAYIAFFMIWLGRYPWWKGILVGVVINALFFVMFEIWFKVPLFKGEFDPLRFLGY